MFGRFILCEGLQTFAQEQSALWWSAVSTSPDGGQRREGWCSVHVDSFKQTLGQFGKKVSMDSIHQPIIRLSQCHLTLDAFSIKSAFDYVPKGLRRNVPQDVKSVKHVPRLGKSLSWPYAGRRFSFLRLMMKTSVSSYLHRSQALPILTLRVTKTLSPFAIKKT